MPAGEITPEASLLLAHLPGDARVVVGIHAARARVVPGLEKLVTWLPEGPLDPGLAGGACAPDARRQLDLMVATLGPRGQDGADRVVVALQGSFTREAIAACIAERPVASGEPLTVVQEGPLTLYAAGARRSYVYWPAADVAVISPPVRSSPGALDRPVGVGSARSNAELMRYVGRVRTGAAFWMAGALPEELQRRLAGLGPGMPAPRGFFVVADGEGNGAGKAGKVRLLCGLRLDGEKQAQGAARVLRRQRADLARALRDARAIAIAERLEIVQSGSEVALRVSLTAAESAMLVEVMTPLLP